MVVSEPKVSEHHNFSLQGKLAITLFPKLFQPKCAYKLRAYGKKNLFSRSQNKICVLKGRIFKGKVQRVKTRFDTHDIYPKS